MKALITGGAGYIGSHTNKYFSAMGIDTVVLDDLSAGHREAVIAGTFVQGDFGDRDTLMPLMQAEKFDAIIHFAAFADVADSVANPAKYYRNNVSAMMTLLNCAVECGVKYIVFSSSAAIYGEPQYTPIDEEHPKMPINPYGVTKLIGERLLNDYGAAYGLRSCSMRYFNAAGADSAGALGESHAPEHHLIPLVQRAAATNGSFSIFGDGYPTRDGSCLRDYVHVEDLAKAHYLGLLYIMEKDCSEAFNLGSGIGFTVKEIIEEFGNLSRLPVRYDVAPNRPGDPAELLASIDKAARLLGWQPEKSEIKTILKDAWNWETHRRY